MDTSDPYERNNLNDQAARDEAADKGDWHSANTPNADAVRATTPDPLIRQAPGDTPSDPDNNVERLADGSVVEAPPASLAGAKDVLAARHAAERNATAGQTVRDEGDVSYETGDQSL